MKRVLTLTIDLEEDGKTFHSNLKHRCGQTKTAIKLIEDYVKRKKRGKGDA